MHLEELHWFVVLAETEHVTAAAAELRIAQPTLSRALARIESDFGAPLFDRVHRRLRLNAYGRVVLDHARRSLAEMESAAERIAAMRDPDKGTVRLAFLHSLASWFVPDALGRFRFEAPQVDFALYQGPGHDITRRVLDGHADLAITSPRPDTAEFGWRGLYVEQLCLVVPRAHRLAGRVRVRLAEVAEETFIALGEGFGLRQLTDEMWQRAGIRPRIRFEAAEIPTMEGLVAAGLGIAVVPVPRPGRGEQAAVYVPLSDARAKRHIGIAWLLGRELPPAAQRFARFLSEHHAQDT